MKFTIYELETALRAAKNLAPKGMGEFTVREMIGAAFKAVEELRARTEPNHDPDMFITRDGFVETNSLPWKGPLK